MDTITTNQLRRTIAALLGTSALLAAGAAGAEDSDKSFEIYGFAQADMIYDFDRLDPAWDDAFRPSKIPTAADTFGSDGQASVSVKQSRFGVKGSAPTGGQPLNFKFEFDLFGVGADAGQTTFRLRHAYGEWGQWLAGQTNSLFMDGDVFPNTIDYWGPAGMVFYRNVQIRWTPYAAGGNKLAFSLERPGNDIDPGQIRLIEDFAGNIQSDEELPDFHAQFRMDRDWGHLQVSGILRRVGAEVFDANGALINSVNDTGWGVNVGTHFNVLGKDAIRIGVVYGEGIASYMNDGGTDLAPTSTGTSLEAKAVPLVGVTAYWDHYWSDQWSSSIGGSFNDQQNTNFQDSGAMDKIRYASANLLYYPAENVMAGVEVLWGDRTDNGGASGDATRFQFTLKYNFGTKL
jgi:hypothetical protein